MKAPIVYTIGKGDPRGASCLGRNLYNRQIYNASTLRLGNRGVPNIRRHPVGVSPLTYPVPLLYSRATRPL